MDQRQVGRLWAWQEERKASFGLPKRREGKKGDRQVSKGTRKRMKMGGSTRERQTIREGEERERDRETKDRSCRLMDGPGGP